jgi:hypothetical protein
MAVAVGAMAVAVGAMAVAVGAMAVAVGAMAVAVGGEVGVGVMPAHTGATCQNMAPMTNRIKIPVMLLEISLGAIDNLSCFHGVLQLTQIIRFMIHDTRNISRRHPAGGGC